MFMDRKNQYSENEYTTQSNVQIQCNPYQATSGIFHRSRTNNFKICMEIKNPRIAKAILRKKSGTGDITFLISLHLSIGSIVLFHFHLIFVNKFMMNDYMQHELTWDLHSTSVNYLVSDSYQTPSQIASCLSFPDFPGCRFFTAEKWTQHLLPSPHL